MTALQDHKVRMVIQSLTEARQMLDNIMYSEPRVSDDEYSRLRECYDKICEANDKL